MNAGITYSRCAALIAVLGFALVAVPHFEPLSPRSGVAESDADDACPLDDGCGGLGDGHTCCVACAPLHAVTIGEVAGAAVHAARSRRISAFDERLKSRSIDGLDRPPRIV